MSVTWTAFLIFHFVLLAVFAASFTVVWIMFRRLKGSRLSQVVDLHGNLAKRALATAESGEELALLQQACATLALGGVTVEPEKLVEVHRSGGDICRVASLLVVANSAGCPLDIDEVLEAEKNGTLDQLCTEWQAHCN